MDKWYFVLASKINGYANGLTFIQVGPFASEASCIEVERWALQGDRGKVGWISGTSPVSVSPRWHVDG